MRLHVVLKLVFSNKFPKELQNGLIYRSLLPYYYYRISFFSETVALIGFGLSPRSRLSPLEHHRKTTDMPHMPNPITEDKNWDLRQQ